MVVWTEDDLRMARGAHELPTPDFDPSSLTSPIRQHAGLGLACRVWAIRNALHHVPNLAFPAEIGDTDTGFRHRLPGLIAAPDQGRSGWPKRPVTNDPQIFPAKNKGFSKNSALGSNTVVYASGVAGSRSRNCLPGQCMAGRIRVCPKGPLPAWSLKI